MFFDPELTAAAGVKPHSLALPIHDFLGRRIVRSAGTALGADPVVGTVAAVCIRLEGEIIVGTGGIVGGLNIQ